MFLKEISTSGKRVYKYSLQKRGQYDQQWGKWDVSFNAEFIASTCDN